MELSPPLRAEASSEATRGQFPNLAGPPGLASLRPCRVPAASGRFVQDEALPAQGRARGEGRRSAGRAPPRSERRRCPEARLELLSEEPEVHRDNRDHREHRDHRDRDRESSPEGSEGRGPQSPPKARSSAAYRGMLIFNVRSPSILATVSREKGQF